MGLYFGSISIHVMVLPRAFSHDELLVELGVLITGRWPVSRTIDDIEYRGTEGTFSSGDVKLRSQLFLFERDGRHFAVGVNAPFLDAERADELAATVMASVR